MRRTHIIAINTRMLYVRSQRILYHYMKPINYTIKTFSRLFHRAYSTLRFFLATLQFVVFECFISSLVRMLHNSFIHCRCFCCCCCCSSVGKGKLVNTIVVHGGMKYTHACGEYIPNGISVNVLVDRFDSCANHDNVDDRIQRFYYDNLQQKWWFFCSLNRVFMAT